jgi:probable blue pigment (indigoidine) exporter
MSSYRDFGLFVLLAAVWGTSYMVAKVALAFIPPVLLAAFRYDLAGGLVLGYAIVKTDQWYPRRRTEWGEVLVGGTLLIAAHFAFLFSGQQYLTSAVAAVITSLIPVLTPLFAWPLLPEERIGSTGVIGILLGFLGVGLIARPASNQLLTSNMLGIVLVFLSAVSFSLGAVLTRRFHTTLPIETMQAWMMLAGAVILHGVSIALPSTSFDHVEWTMTTVLALAYLAIIAGAGGFLIYFDLLDRLGAVEINLIDYVLPIFAAASGWLVLNEQIRLNTIFGFLFIFTGFILIKRRAIAAEFGRVRNIIWSAWN